MIKRNPLNIDWSTNDQLQKIAKKNIDVHYEIHNLDRENSINHECQKIEVAITVLYEYLTENEITFSLKL